jgi:hypothetical protein
MQRLITEIAESIIVLLLLYALIIAFRHRGKNLKLITIYVLVSTIFSSVDTIMFIFNSHDYRLLSVMYNSYDIFEFLIINSFIFSRLRSASFRIINILCVLVYFSMCYIDFSHFYFTNHTPILSGIGYIFIAIPSLLLLFEILKSDLTTDLRLNPDFLIASGLLFYFSLSVPMSFFLGNAFFTNNILDISEYLVSINYIFYLVLLYTFIVAYSCPPIKSAI